MAKTETVGAFYTYESFKDNIIVEVKYFLEL